MWRPYEPCREHEEQARRERDGAADDEMFERAAFSSAATRALTSHMTPISERAASLRERIAKAREQ